MLKLTPGEITSSIVKSVGGQFDLARRGTGASASRPELKVGSEVVRDELGWCKGNEDGGPGSKGKVQEKTSSGKWKVRWSNGTVAKYAYPDASGEYPIRLASAPKSGSATLISAVSKGLLVRGDRARLRAIFGHATPADLQKMRAADAAESGEGPAAGAAADGGTASAGAAEAEGGSSVSAPAGPPTVSDILESEAYLTWPPEAGKPFSFVYFRSRPKTDAKAGAAAAAGSSEAGWGEWSLAGAVKGTQAEMVDLKPSTEYEVKVAAGTGKNASDAPASEAADPVSFATPPALLCGQIHLEGDKTKRVAEKGTGFEVRGLPASTTRLVHAVLGVRQGKATWQFAVKDVGSGDDAKLAFGAITVPRGASRSRGSSSSSSTTAVFSGLQTDGQMRNGSTVRAADGEIAIAPGSVIEVQADAEARTIAVSVDGKSAGKIEGVVAGTMHPAIKIEGGVSGMRSAALTSFTAGEPEALEAPPAASEACSGGEGVPAYRSQILRAMAVNDSRLAKVNPRGMQVAFAAQVAGAKHGRKSGEAASGGSASAAAATAAGTARRSGGSGSWGVRAAILPEFDGDVLALALSDTYVNSLEHKRALARANVHAVSAAAGRSFGASTRGGPASGAGADDDGLAAPPMLRRVTTSGGAGAAGRSSKDRAKLGVEVLRDCYERLVDYVDGGFEGSRADEELVEYVNEAARAKDWKTSKLLGVTWDEVVQVHPVAKDKGEEASLKSYPHLRRLPEADRRGRLAARFKLLQTLNRMVAKALPWIDFSRSLEPASLASRISSIARLVFEPVKLPLFWAAMERTKNSSGGESSINVDRLRPTARLGGGLKDTEGRHTVFSQVFRKFHSKPPKELRKSGKFLDVSFKGEGAIDAGGPYRELIGAIMPEDLMSDRMDLFLPVPNAAAHVGSNWDLMLPNPGARSKTSLALFTFVGKFFGLIMRQKIYIPMRLSSIVWKALCNQEADESDLWDVDEPTMTFVQKIRQLGAGDGGAATGGAAAGGMSDDVFRQKFELTYSTSTLDGRQVELRSGGKRRPVTFDGRHDWCAARVRYRLREEFAPQLAAMRAGLATVIPQRVLSLFSWREVERLVCGARTVDVKVLREMCELSGYSKTDKTIELFWEVMEEMSQEDRCKFIRFAWGRSTLPISKKDWGDKFKISKYSGSPGSLPLAHTCFFQIELPPYETKKDMEDKLQLAINTLSMMNG